jgi:uncharacterized cupin superfamily protein
MSARHAHVTNIEEVEWSDGPKHGSRFGSRTKRLGTAVQAKRLGCSMYEVAPGKRAFPLHAHVANEEAVYILEGSGTMRLGDKEVAVHAGDYIAFLPGESHAHQLINTSSGALRYLCISTMIAPEIAIYPDSDKIGILGGETAPMRMLIKKSATGTWADYFDGEKGD